MRILSSHMKYSLWSCASKAAYLSLLFLYCEVIVYYVVLLQCSWPDMVASPGEGAIHPFEETQALKVMLLSDTHLLGPRKGHWFDRLRREWQMHRAFQTAMTIFSPDAVAFLGDIFDEGQYSDEREFEVYMERFYSLFYVPQGTKVLIAVGNHDVGFHYRMYRYSVSRFNMAFNMSSVHMAVIKGNVFVLLNSMAMHGDWCDLCAEAEDQLEHLNSTLWCSEKRRTMNQDCRKVDKLYHYSRPILLQHFPLYRESDSGCAEPDAAPAAEKDVKFRERWDCLSKESTRKLLTALNPRAIFAGHTHHGCLVMHDNDIPEWTLPSFSWRNKNNPSFALAVFTPNNFAVSKCYMPQECTIIWTYVLGTLFMLLWTIRGNLIAGGKILKPSKLCQ